jgi:membrane fusion protein, multidrug efflux system
MIATLDPRRTLAPTLLLLGATLAAGCGGSGQAEQAGAEPAPVLVGPENLYVAVTDTLRTGPIVSGTLTPEREATVRAELGGTVVNVQVEEGQHVNRGQLLARLSDDAVKDAALSARSAIRTAEQAAQVAHRNAERAEKLAQAGAMADRDLEQAQWTATNADGAVADAKARLAAAEKQLGYTEIRSPLAGVVSERRTNAGDVVQVGNPLFTVIDPSSLRLEAQVPVSALESLRPGTAVPFSVDGYGARFFEGKIVRINPAVDPTTRQVRVTVSLPNTSGRLAAGLFAQGRAALESRVGVVVPISAIDRRGLRPTVTRLANGAAERVEVDTGIEDATSDRVEIVSGIAPGDTLIIGSARTIQPGTRIRPAAAAEQGGGGR